MLLCDKETFAQEVLEAPGTILVDFFGDGCQPCAALVPHLTALEEEYGKKIKFCQLNTTKARRLAISQKVLGLPTIAIYQQGEKQAELIKDQATPAAIAALLAEYSPK